MLIHVKYIETKTTIITQRSKTQELKAQTLYCFRNLISEIKTHNS